MRHRDRAAPIRPPGIRPPAAPGRPRDIRPPAAIRRRDTHHRAVPSRLLVTRRLAARTRRPVIVFPRAPPVTAFPAAAGLGVAAGADSGVVAAEAVIAKLRG